MRIDLVAGWGDDEINQPDWRFHGRQNVSWRIVSARRKKPKPAGSRRKWSQAVTKKSDALDLEAKVIAKPDAEGIADSVKRSAERSSRRKAGPFQSAMSMINFYINRAGKNLSATRKRVLGAAKNVLRLKFGRKAKPTK
jgi:hypothetical protein